MSKKATTRVSPAERLVERQAKLWSHAEAIEIAQKRGEVLPADVSEWLVRAFKNIACGKDANVVFDVMSERQGVRKDGFLQQMQRKISNGYIAAATEQTLEGKKKTTTKALDEISAAMPKIKRPTAKKNWNSALTDRSPTFTLGKK